MWRIWITDVPEYRQASEGGDGGAQSVHSLTGVELPVEDYIEKCIRDHHHASIYEDVYAQHSTALTFKETLVLSNERHEGQEKIHPRRFCFRLPSRRRGVGSATAARGRI